MTESVGAILTKARQARGLSIEQVARATRIRAPQIQALEEDAPERIAAPVYARGYLRSYAAYLELDVEALVDRSGSRPLAAPRRRLAGPRRHARLLLTRPIAAALALLLGCVLGGLWIQRQVDAQAVAAAVPVSRGGQPAARTVGPARSLTVAMASPLLRHRTVRVGIRATRTIWVDVRVDGVPATGANGRFMQPGDSLAFSGREIKVSSGFGAGTMITVDGRYLGALGDGVTSDVFAAQT